MSSERLVWWFGGVQEDQRNLNYYKDPRHSMTVKVSIKVKKVLVIKIFTENPGQTFHTFTDVT